MLENNFFALFNLL